MVKRIVWISVRHDGELKVRSSLYIAKPRYLGICVSSNLASTYFLTALHCFLPLLPDMTRSEAGHRLFWSYALRSSYVGKRDIRVALV